MNSLMLVLLSASLSGTLMALVFLALRYLVGRRISKTGCYYIWLLVLLRFLIPYSPVPGIAGYAADRVRGAAGRMQGTQVSQPYAPVSETIYGEPAAEASPKTESVPAFEEKGGGQPVAAWENKETGNGIFSFAGLGRLLWLLWLFPAVVLLSVRVCRYLGFQKQLKKKRVLSEDPAITGICAKLCREMGWKTEIGVYECAGIYSPMLTGFRKPFLVIPDQLWGKWREEMPEGQRKLRAEYVLRHELVHLRRRDLYYKWLVQAAVCIHWFNPLLRKIADEISKDCELSCDEAVIDGLPLAGRIAYGDTLMASLQALNAPVRREACAGLLENANLMKERLGAIMKYEKKTAGKRKAAAVLLAGILMLTGVICGGFSAKADEITGMSSIKTTQGAIAADRNLTGNTANTAGTQNKVIRAGEEMSCWGDNMAYNAWTGQYASSCFYKNGYFIQLAWNNGPENYRTVQTVTASDRDWQIAFSEGTDALAGNADFMEALKLCILEQKSREEKAGPSGFWSDKNKMEHPVVSYVEGPYSQTPDDLAQKTYSEEDSFALYVTVVDEVSPETAKALTERAYQEGDASRFSVTMGSMSEDSRFALAVKTYEEDDISMFSIICSELSEEHRKQLLDRAKKEQNSNYYYILKNDLEG